MTFTRRSAIGLSLSYLYRAKTYYAEHHDYANLLIVLDYEQGIYGRQGNLRKVFDIRKEVRTAFNQAGEPVHLRIRSTEHWELIWAGRYFAFEQSLRQGIEASKSAQDQELLVSKIRDLAVCLGLQGKYPEAFKLADEGVERAQALGSIGESDLFVALTFLGIVLLKAGGFNEAEMHLNRALTIGKELHAHLDLNPIYLGILYEILNRWHDAEDSYKLSLEQAQPSGRLYFVSAALTGLIRVQHAQAHYDSLSTLLGEAVHLATTYQYNDHLASLHLIQAHLAFDSHLDVGNDAFDTALSLYQQALIYALRYNRFLLDEVLAGRPQGTPLHAIIPHALMHGEAGQKLLTALRNWWRMATNNTGIPCPDTIAPIPDDIPLLDAERMAREREPGDGSPQRDMIEQVEAALASASPPVP